jgi:acetyl-CoA C-acetyltransferase
MSEAAAERIPVIIGAGEINDRPEIATEGLDSLGLMAAALQAADRDAGGNWLGALDALHIVNQISWPVDDIVRELPQRLGIAPGHVVTSGPSGDSPVRYLNDAANRIAAGLSEVAAIAGGEALRTAAARARAGQAAAPSKELMRERAEAAASPLRLKYGLLTPTDIYPLYENATRAAWGMSLEAAQAESAEIWSLFAETAAQNPHAWIRERYTPERIARPSPDNRPIAHPYSKLMVANSAVNQGAALIVTSLARARAAGIAEDRLVYLWAGAGAKEPDNFLERDRYDHSPSMTVVLEQVLARNGLTAGDLDCAELYSCFPCVPKMARRIIGWPANRPASTIGGLTFAGGPIANYMSHAAAGMVTRLRQGDRVGLLYGNGGYVTKNHALILSRDPPPASLLGQDYDVQALADARRGAIPALLDLYAGPGVIETYTVLYDRDGAARFGAIIGRTPDGARFLARVPKEDAGMIGFLVSGEAEPVGTKGEAVIAGSGLAEWRG